MKNNVDSSKINKSPAFVENQNARYGELLTRAGLNEKEALIFNALLEKGEMRAGEIISLVNLKRGDTYNHIYSLQQKGLIEEDATGGWKRFRLEHPSKIEEFVENRSKELTEAKKELSAVIPGILSTYNLTYHKPGVKVFEGEEAIDKVLSDSLSSNTEIYEYLDPSQVDAILEAPNKKYVKKRIEAKLVKKLLVPDTPFSKKRYGGKSSKYTQIRALDFPIHNFQTIMQIYDNKISYLTLTEEKMIAVIIEDPYIYKMHKSLFEVSWSSAEAI